MSKGTVALIALALALLPALSACSSRPGTDGRPALARNAIPGLLGRHCEYVSSSSQLPSFSHLARLGTRGNVSLWGHDLAPTDSVVLSVRYDEEGNLAWVHAIQSSLAADRVIPLEQLLLRSMNEQGPTDWGVRVRVVGGEIAGVEPSVICPAEPRTGLGAPVIPMPVTRDEVVALQNARGRRFPMEISLDELGMIRGVRLARSSGQAAVDQFLLDWMHNSKFHPKLHDGIRLATTFQRTVYIPFDRRPRLPRGIRH